jgi:hypothetical protein
MNFSLPINPYFWGAYIQLEERNQKIFNSDVISGTHPTLPELPSFFGKTDEVLTSQRPSPEIVIPV